MTFTPLRRAINAGATLLIIIISALAALGGYILVVAATNPPRHHNPSASMFTEENFSYIADRELGGVVKPGSHARGTANGREIDYFHGPLGQRIPQPGASSPPDSPLLVLGCSIAWGQSVEGTDTFAHQIAAGLGVDYINLSVAGSGSIYNAVRLHQQPQLRPQVIVYGLYEDHLNRNVRPCAPVDHPMCHQMATARPDRNGQMRLHAPDFFLERYFGGLMPLMQRFYLEQYEGSPRGSFANDVFWTAVKLYSDVYRRVAVTDYSGNDAVKIGALDLAVGQMAAYAAERNARLMIVWIPLNTWPQPQRPLPPDVRQVLERHGAGIVDMAADWNALYPPHPEQAGPWAPFVTPNDGHPNELGHATIAKAVVAALRAEGYRPRATNH